MAEERSADRHRRANPNSLPTAAYVARGAERVADLAILGLMAGFAAAALVGLRLIRQVPGSVSVPRTI